MAQGLEPDKELAEQALQGVEGSWRQIYESTCDRLFAFLCFQVGDREEARDLLQETYLQAYRSLGSFRGDAPLEVWLRAIALRKSLDWKRTWLRRLKRTVGMSEAVLTVEPDVDGVHFDSEDLALRQGLASLSSHQRAALLMREWEGRSFREIARLLGCKESTARVHHTRARERMRAALMERVVPLGSPDWEGQRT